MVNWHWYLYGFGLGTFKYMPSQWFVYWSTLTKANTQLNFWELFIPTYLGALISMAFFYFLSDYFMERAVVKRTEKIEKLKAQDIQVEPRKVFTKMNKLMVRIKRMFNIYIFTFLAPLFLSIPLGSIVCAKFYGHKKKTYPLMALNMAIYGAITSLIIVALYE
jgi:membrane protein implicated in regulation of membrane protease activity